MFQQLLYNVGENCKNCLDTSFQSNNSNSFGGKLYWCCIGKMLKCSFQTIVTWLDRILSCRAILMHFLKKILVIIYKSYILSILRIISTQQPGVFVGEKVTKFHLLRKKFVQKIMSKLIEYCMQNCRWHITQLYTRLFLRASKYISAKNALKLKEKNWAKIQFAIF